MRLLTMLLAVALSACSQSPTVTVTKEPAGSNCAAGGVKVESGTTVEYACNGSSMGSETAAQLLAKVVTVDGPGSMLDADTVDGHDSSELLYTAGTGVSIVGQAISVDPTVVQSRVTGTCAAGEAMASVAANGDVNCTATTPFTSIVVVSATGTPTENGAALRAALTATTGSAARHVLVKIEPGDFDFGANAFVVAPFIDIEGSGEDATVLRSSVSGGTLRFNHDEPVEVRSLTVISTGVAQFSAAIGVGGSGASNGLRKLSHLTVKDSGGTGFNYAISGGSQPLLVVDCTLVATGPNAAGVFSNSNEHVEIYGSRVIGNVVSQSGEMFVSGTRVDGAANQGAQCFGCFNAGGAPLNAMCN